VIPDSNSNIGLIAADSCDLSPSTQRSSESHTQSQLLLHVDFAGGLYTPGRAELNL
jgi:hypothetical protein